MIVFMVNHASGANRKSKPSSTKNILLDAFFDHVLGAAHIVKHFLYITKKEFFIINPTKKYTNVTVN